MPFREQSCPTAAAAPPLPSCSQFNPCSGLFSAKKKKIACGLAFFFSWLTLSVCLWMPLSFQKHLMCPVYRLSCPMMYRLSRNKAQLRAVLLFREGMNVCMLMAIPALCKPIYYQHFLPMRLCMAKTTTTELSVFILWYISSDLCLPSLIFLHRSLNR